MDTDAPARPRWLCFVGGLLPKDEKLQEIVSA